MPTKSKSLRIYIPWRTRGFPIEWEEEFPNRSPVDLEIGFGNGEYLVRCAGENPDHNFIGIEMTWGSIKRASSLCLQNGLSNVRLIWDDARTALKWSFKERTLNSITALYPCPWPKKRHAKFRLFKPSFIRLCNSRLKDGGTLAVVTDSAVYKDEILESNLPKDTGMEVELENIPASFNTKYEKKWEDGGQTEFYKITFRKAEHISIPNPEVITVKHHVVPHLNPRNLKLQDEKEPFSIQFKQLVYDVEQGLALLEVFCHEDTIEQHFHIRLKKQEKGWKIHPAGGPPLLPIGSVQRALDIVKEAAADS